jgi:hypothetical protein
MQAPKPLSCKLAEMDCTCGVSLGLSYKPRVLLELCHPNLPCFLFYCYIGLRVVEDTFMMWIKNFVVIFSMVLLIK